MTIKEKFNKIIVSLAILIFAIILIQPVDALTYTINTNATGGDCALIGTWNAGTLKCTLTTGVIQGNIIFGANNITLDGAGKNINGSGSGITMNGLYGITVLNTNLTNFTTPIYFNPLSHNNNATNNTIIGSVTYGILISSSHNNTVVGNRITNPTSTSVYVTNSNNNTIRDNIFPGGNSDGIGLSLSNNSFILNNTITSHTAGYGIYITSSLNNTIIGNNISSNLHGIGAVTSSGNTTLNNNTILNSSMTTGNGLYILSSNDSILNNNSIMNSRYGIYINVNSNNNTLIYNNMSYNYYGITISSYSNNTTVYRNNISNCGYICLYTTGFSNYSNETYNSIFNSSGYGISADNVTNTVFGWNIINYTRSQAIALAVGIASHANSNDSINDNIISNSNMFPIDVENTINSLIYNNLIDINSSMMSEPIYTGENDSAMNTSGIVGYHVWNSSIYNNTIFNNTKKFSGYGIELTSASQNNNVYGNNITNVTIGIIIWTYFNGYSDDVKNNSVYNNNISNTSIGIQFSGVSRGSVYGISDKTRNNIISSNFYGISNTQDIVIDYDALNTTIRNIFNRKIEVQNQTTYFDFGGQISSFNASSPVNVTISKWNIDGDYSKTWTESSNTHDATNLHVIGDFPANTLIQAQVDGVNSSRFTSDVNGYISFTYNGWSEHQFDFFLGSVGRCEGVTPSINTAFTLFGVVLVFVAIGGFILSLRSLNAVLLMSSIVLVMIGGVLIYVGLFAVASLGVVVC